MRILVLSIFFAFLSLFSYADENQVQPVNDSSSATIIAADTTQAFLNHEIARLKEEKNALKNDLSKVNIKMASIGAFLGLALSFLALFIFLFLRLRRRYRIDTEELKKSANPSSNP